MDTHITQLPKDVLRIIATCVCFNRPRSRWGVYAVFRLVCRRFWQCIPVRMLADALDTDISELPVVCAADPGESCTLHYILLAKKKVVDTISMTYTDISFRCNQHAPVEPMVSFKRQLHPFPPIIFPINAPRHTILAELLSYMHVFRKYGISNQGKDVWLCVSTSYHVYIQYLIECESHSKKKMAEGASKNEQREAHRISYVWECGPDTRPMYVGPCPRTDLDAYCAKCTLGVGVFINMTPLDLETLTYNENVTKDTAYMRHYNKDHESVEEMKVPPLQYREAALPNEPLGEMCETKQVEFYVSRARKVATYLKEHPHLTPYFHYRSGAQEEALLALLVWYHLDKTSCPWEDPTAWLKEKDYLQVLRDDEEVLFFKKLVEATNKTAKPNALTSWLKKTKR